MQTQHASRALEVLFLLTCCQCFRATFFRGEDISFAVIFVTRLSSYGHVFVFLIVASFVSFQAQTHQYYLTILMDQQKVVQ